jgi:hypothetical protein
MILNIERDKNYSDKVIATDIHGKYPYKLYLEIKGSSKIGRYIVVISDEQLNKDSSVEMISIKLDKKKRKTPRIESNTNIIRPNTVSNDDYYVNYKVRETSILEVGDSPILVYKAGKIKKKGIFG